MKEAISQVWDLAQAVIQPSSARGAGGGGNDDASRNRQVARSGADRLEIHVRDVDIAALLEMLSYQARVNIVASTSVTGAVSANLYDVSLQEALDAVLIPNGFAYHRIGSTLFVGTHEEIASQGPPPETRVYKLRFISRSEATAAVESMLGPTGKIAEDPEGGTAAAGTATAGTSSTSVDYIIVTDSPPRLDRVSELLEQIDVRPTQVLIEATILRATLNDGNEFGIDFTVLGGVDFQAVGSTSIAGQDLQTGRLPAAQFQNTTINANTQVTPDIEGGFTFGVIKDQVSLFVRALEEITDVAVVANPKITALNRQEGRVIVGRRDGYLTTTVTETAAIQTVDFLETGTQVRFRPFVNGDGTVRLLIHPKDSNGGLTTANLPFEETTEAETEILVNDGYTVLIGGLFRERTVASRSQVPVLGGIPVLGLLFQGIRDETIREEVIVLLTVHVLKGTVEESDRFAELLQDVERIRVGMRMGLFGIGRERLAQAFYAEAVRHAADDPARALMNARMALNNQPKHLAAFRLKEQLLGERLWEEDGGRMRTFLVDLVSSAEDEPFGRPSPNRPIDPEVPTTGPEGSDP